MPFKSEAQRRLFHVKAAKGEISDKTVSEWEHATKNKKKLPMHLREKAAYVAGGVAATARFNKTANAGMLTPAQRAATAVVQGGSSLILNAALTPKEDRVRQGLIGGASDALGGYLGGLKGMGASMGANMALQQMTAPRHQERYAALLKEAFHADDRFKERIKAKLPANTLDQLRDQAKDLRLSPGRYYLTVNDKAGNPAAVAAFKTVGKDNQLVLATVLKPKDSPPSGTSISHLMRQPLGALVGKIDATPKTYTIRKKSDGRYTCTCNDYKFRSGPNGQDCKHIDAHLKKTSPF